MDNRVTTLVSTFLLSAMAVISTTSQAETLETVTVQNKVMVSEQVVDAVIEAVFQTTVSAETSGRVTKVFVDVDNYVEKDAVVVTIRDTDQRAALAAAKAQADEAEGSFKRVKDLLAKKLVSKSDYDKAEAGYKAAKAAQARAQEQLDNTIVRAPYSGIVTKRHVEPGETVNPGTPLMTGVSLESLRAVASVSQKRIGLVRKLASARVIIDDKRSIKGEKLTFTPYADPTTHTFLVRVDLPYGNHGLYPGTYTKVAFATGEKEWLMVPESSIVHRSEVTAAYDVNKGKVSFRYVRVGKRFDNGMISVLAGLDAGEQVAVDPIRAGVVLKQQRQGKTQGAK